MKAPAVVSVTDVIEFLQLNRSKYQILLQELGGHFFNMFDTFEAQRRVYRIYSRSDKQRGEIFKDPWKIQYKINKERVKNARYKVSDLGDIVGMTIVVPYPSDIDFVRSLIDMKIRRKQFLSFHNTRYKRKSVYGESKTDKGYHAFHYQLGINTRDLTNVICEVQVKTVLHDAWGAKTHDLTYKAAGEVDIHLKEVMESFGNDLASLDQKSESLKNKIEETVNIERRKLQDAIAGFFDSEPENQDQKYIQKFEKLKTFIRSKKKDLSAGKEEVVDKIIADISDILQSGVYRDACRLYCLVAAVSLEKQLFELAVDKLNEWFIEGLTSGEKATALFAKSLTYYSFGRSVDAIMVGERALSEFVNRQNPESKEAGDREMLRTEVRLKNNLAYFYADIVESDAGEKLEAGEKCGKYIEEAIAAASSLGVYFDSGGVSVDQGSNGDALLLGCALLDTRGAVQIACANSLEELQAGKATSHLALQLIERSDVSPQAKEHQRRLFGIQDFRFAQRSARLMRNRE